ncbi:ATP-binding protein [Gandjariella thermophila]|uniref:ATP-binding protein n=1 Tax=Gandjariella thermophila TaxID=1931992 RepID=UPI001CEF6A14|nr:ATP-binding protein [Gandjariella thermophila]
MGADGGARGGLRQEWPQDLSCRTVPAVAERLTPLRHALADWARRVGLSPEITHDVVLASYEAMANVVEHAYHGGGGVLDLHATYSSEHVRVSVTVADYGRWRPPADDPGPLHGRGLSLIRTLASRAEVEPGPRGTTVRMHWLLDRATAPGG